MTCTRLSYPRTLPPPLPFSLPAMPSPCPFAWTTTAHHQRLSADITSFMLFPSLHLTPAFFQPFLHWVFPRRFPKTLLESPSLSLNSPGSSGFYFCVWSYQMLLQDRAGSHLFFQALSGAPPTPSYPQAVCSTAYNCQ